MIISESRKGSSAVFLTIILAALVSISLTLVFAARNKAEISFGDGVMNLAADSILGEYDYYIQRDYGLFLLGGGDKYLSGRLGRYAGYSLSGIKGLDLGKTSVNAGRYSTADTGPVREQILAYMKSPAGAKRAAASGASFNGGSADSEADVSSGHTLRHGPTIVSLPSRSLPDKSLITAADELAENLKNPEAIFKEGTSRYMIDSYVLSVFNNSEHATGNDHFFNNEVEYILCGELSDEKNLKKTDTALKTLRSGLNLSHIYSDPKKTAAVAAAAEVITPGVLGTVTQAGISLAWAAAEAENDVRLLHAGHRVPVIKDDLSWAIDLDSLISGYNPDSGCIYPETDRGRSYADYLRILLYIRDDNVKTARILDLIQINMRKNHDADFLIQEYATGISIDSEVNGEKLVYDKTY